MSNNATRKNPVQSFSTTPDIKERFDAICMAQGFSKSKIISQLIEEWLYQFENSKNGK